MKKKILQSDEIFIKIKLQEGLNSQDISELLSKEHGYRISPRTVREHSKNIKKKKYDSHPRYTHCDCGVSYSRHIKCSFCSILLHDEVLCKCRTIRVYQQEGLLHLAAAIFDHAKRAGAWNFNI